MTVIKLTFQLNLTVFTLFSWGNIVLDHTGYYKNRQTADWLKQKARSKIDRKTDSKEIEESPERKANCLLRSGVMSAAQRGLLSNCMISSGQKTGWHILVTSGLKSYDGKWKLKPLICLIILLFVIAMSSSFGFIWHFPCIFIILFVYARDQTEGLLETFQRGSCLNLCTCWAATATILWKEQTTVYFHCTSIEQSTISDIYSKWTRNAACYTETQPGCRLWGIVTMKQT